MQNFFQVVGVLSLVFFMLFAAAVIFAYPIMWCWNYGLVPAINGINKIDFWQALGIFFLIKILFSPSSNLNNNEKK